MREKTLLLVDDDPDDIELIRLHLRTRQARADVLVARDGVEAWELLVERVESDPVLLPDMVVADIKMPRMTGLELLRRVREDERLARLPVVVLTSSANDDDRAATQRWGAHYLRKPTRAEEFDEVVSRILSLLGETRSKNP